ncbi:MAG: hypothetical protein CBB97_16205 [Candidatus Endolissoclinum sp. TMED37]|nr:MAG: hypothetical protein CBB97_16205 [Candidatus Endolissoclinum sp. TMED37]|tara:strand:- start:1392 stop:1643 length:252 start_codon:yes stop_codon:yes gene_type:complete
MLKVKQLGRGFAWLDTGTHETLLEAGNFVKTLTERQALQLGSPDEVAFRLKYIDKKTFEANANLIKTSSYGRTLLSITIKHIS